THGARAVRVENDLDAVAIARERLIDRIVDGLVDEVMKAVGPRVTDVHRGTLPNRLEPLEDLDITRVVAIGAHAAPRKAAELASLTSPFLTFHQWASAASVNGASAVVRNTWPTRETWLNTRAWTAGSSSESASSSRMTGALPTASSTGAASARRNVSAIRRCCPRDPNVRRSRPCRATRRSSRWGPTSVWPRRISSGRRARRRS